MRKILMGRRILIGALLALAIPLSASASEGAKPEARNWSFQGVFGTFDRPALKRGLQVYLEVCASCHSLDMLSYRHLLQIGLGEDEVKKIAAEFEVEDGPNDEGEMYARPAKLSDPMVPPFANKKAASAANNGAVPPDLSLIIRARKNGPDYVYGLLTGYKEEAPKGFDLSEGMNYNAMFPGHQIAMAPPLSDESVEYADGTKATLGQHAEDIVTFLSWAAQPEMEERKRLGIRVLLFLLVLTAMLYALKRQIWSDIH